MPMTGSRHLFSLLKAMLMNSTIACCTVFRGKMAELKLYFLHAVTSNYSLSRCW